MEYNYLGISEVNNYIKSLIDKDYFLNKVYIKGEISNFKNHTRGHLYFTLKDDSSRINAVMFASSAKNLDFVPEDGNQVLIEGRISCYPASGSYQIYVEKMSLDGIGRLFVEYEKLKKKLAGEGLFNPEHKKKIPKYPMKVGVITADTGAAIKDIVSTIKRRFPICQVILFPSLVQGPDAKYNIVNQIKKADTYNLDTIIVGRGGGSIEDLWAFNEEIVADAIFKSKIPIISAVGHEIDFTISDFVADLRAPTPTAAAELAVPNTIDLINYINQLSIRRNKSIINIINKKYEKLESLKDSYILKNPQSIYEVKAQKVDNLIEKAILLITKSLTDNKNRLNTLDKEVKTDMTKVLDKKTNRYLNILSKLETLNPILTIKRGYTITKHNDKSINSVKDINKKDYIKTEVCDGIITSQVIDMEEK